MEWLSDCASTSTSCPQEAVSATRNHRIDQSLIFCHRLSEFPICFFIQKSVKLLYEFNLRTGRKGKRSKINIREFSSFWFCIFKLLLFSRRNYQLRNKPLKKPLNQAVPLKEHASQEQVTGIQMEAAELSSTSNVIWACRLGKLKSLTVLKNLLFLFLKEAQLSVLAAKHYEGSKYKVSVSLAIITPTITLSL